MQKRGLKMEKLTIVMKDLENEVTLNPKYKEHPQIGNYKGFLECHIEADCLLIYKTYEKEMYFTRKVTHSGLFK
jgi:mRNA interferase YafQ